MNRGEGYGNRYAQGGSSIGGEYYYTDDKSVFLNLGGFGYVAAFHDTSGPDIRDDFSNVYISAQFGRDIKRFQFKYGLQYNSSIHSQYLDTDSTWWYGERIFDQYEGNVGLALSAYYRQSNGFNLGLNYYPSGITWDGSKLVLQYAHQLWFELIFPVEVKRPSTRRSGIWVAR